MKLVWFWRSCGALIATYLVIGIIVSSVLAYAVPATSLAGRAYLIAFWPALIKGSPFKAPFPPGNWAFDFK